MSPLLGFADCTRVVSVDMFFCPLHFLLADGETGGSMRFQIQVQFFWHDYFLGSVMYFLIHIIKCVLFHLMVSQPLMAMVRVITSPGSTCVSCQCEGPTSALLRPVT